MAMKLISEQEHDFQILIHCPSSGEQVLGNNLLHFSMPGGKGAWWYCPACQGWHVLVYTEEKESDNFFNLKVKPCYLAAV